MNNDGKIKNETDSFVKNFINETLIDVFLEFFILIIHSSIMFYSCSMINLNYRITKSHRIVLKTCGSVHFQLFVRRIFKTKNFLRYLMKNIHGKDKKNLKLCSAYLISLYTYVLIRDKTYRYN